MAATRRISPEQRTATAAVLTTTALLFAACSGDTAEVPESGGLSGDLEDVYDINEIPVDGLQDGGELTFSITLLGPNFNSATNAGNTIANGTVLGPQHNVSAWTLDPLGEYVLNEDYFLSAEQEITDDGTQVLTYELNPEAVWNDGTPIDFHTYEHTLDIRSGANEEYDLVSTTMYDQVESAQMGEDEYSFTVTMAEPFQPWELLFNGGIIHPDVDSADEFNNGFVDDVRPEYRAGPFILDIHDQSANVMSLVPNPNWWGDEPVLERINFAQHEASSTIQAFQNGEIDSVGLGTEDRYSELTNWSDEGYEIRRGQQMYTGGYLFNVEAREVSDAPVREAIFQAVDRKQLADIRFQGLNWEEEPPGAWTLMPFDERYEDAYPVQDADPEGARQTLLDAGWEGEEGEILTRDGEELTVTLTNFGDDPTNQAVDQAFQTMAREAGINLEIDNRGSGEFGEVYGGRDFALLNVGYSKTTADPTSATRQFYSTGDGNVTGAGDEELDARIDEMFQVEHIDDRITMAQEIEQDAIDTHLHYLGVYNGPIITAYREGLANYGPRLFETTDWTIVGWAADAGHDGSDTGGDVEDLDDTEDTD
ncbi:MAG TPA: ABC transporter family substrate-binding protein [Beutenbergiaceae bacterium]|nr:ABC transporter family substrate-binding protein [Beutenbergiaceae bacterium]